MVKLSFYPSPIVVGMSFNRLCQAGCIWCPIGCRLNKDIASMSMETVDNIISNLKTIDFKELWFGENGEAILHPKFREIVTKFRDNFPDIPFAVNSNLNHLDRDMINFLFEKDFWWVGFNFDGITKEGYEAVKKLPFEKARENLELLISMRNKMNPSTTLHCSILTQPHYYTSINQPEKITVKDEENEVFRYMKDRVEWGYSDTILIPFVLTWAIREEQKIIRENKNIMCIGAHSLGTKMFIDPDGGVYPCCSDYNSDYIYGNINTESIMDIWNGIRRKQFLDWWLNQDWESIQKPCMYCQD